MAEITQETLLDLLRDSPEVPPTQTALLFKALAEMNNHLEDVKLKLDINNEIALELLELRRDEARPDFGSQASPYRNKPPRSLGRWN